MISEILWKGETEAHSSRFGPRVPAWGGPGPRGLRGLSCGSESSWGRVPRLVILGASQGGSIDMSVCL